MKNLVIENHLTIIIISSYFIFPFFVSIDNTVNYDFLGSETRQIASTINWIGSLLQRNNDFFWKEYECHVDVDVVICTRQTAESSFESLKKKKFFFSFLIRIRTQLLLLYI